MLLLLLQNVQGQINALISQGWDPNAPGAVEGLLNIVARQNAGSQPCMVQQGASKSVASSSGGDLQVRLDVDADAKFWCVGKNVQGSLIFLFGGLRTLKAIGRMVRRSAWQYISKNGYGCG